MRYSCFYILLMLFVLVSCTDTDSDTDSQSSEGMIRERIAVVLPLSGSVGQSARMRRTVDWVRRNIEQAQLGLDRRISIEIEWHDEDREDIARLSEQFAERTDLKVVIGPYRVESAQIMSSVLGQVDNHEDLSGKVLICPRMASDEIVRQFNMSPSTAKLKRFFWALSETDVTQCEVLLSKAYNEGARSVGLLACDDMYGATFYNWFAYQAREMGMRPVYVDKFSRENLSSKVNEAMRCGADYLICVPDDAESVASILENHSHNNLSAPKLLFSDAARNDDVLRLCGNASCEGVSLCADPQSGFIQSYQARFGEAPTTCESVLYDAVMLAAYALLDAECEGNGNVNDALDRILASSQGDDTYVWEGMNMRQMFRNIIQRKYMNIAGASGILDFDRATFSNATSSTYSHWCVYDGQFVDMEYVSSEGNNRVSPTMGSWNWKTTVFQHFADNTFVRDYPALHERWAVVVATSSGWFNYRHQADALSVYQLLKSYGYDDDHIVLITDDDIAYDHRNPLQGEIRNSMDGQNLRQDIHVDYMLKELKPQDLVQILCGESDERLREVIHPDNDDNIFVYWVGHGLPDVLVWGYDEKTVTAGFVRNMQERLSAQGKYRKLMWLTEACFSASVMQGVQGYNGCMAMCSASDSEQSWGENNGIGTWMTNRFTRIWRETVSQNPAISYNELYIHLAKGTIGSHVTVINEDRFDNMYKGSMKDFLQ